MRIPYTLTKYLSRHFLFSCLLVFATVVAMILLFDTLEILRRAHDKNLTSAIIFQMVLFKLPSIVLEMLPFIILIGSLLTFSRLTRSSELVVARAAGISAWQFLFPIITVSFVVGLLVITILNPISATMLGRYEMLKNKHFGGGLNTLAVSSTGLWLKQENHATGGKTVIHALRAVHDTSSLYDVTIFTFDAHNLFDSRIYTKQAMLRKGYWDIQEGLLTRADTNIRPETLRNYHLATVIRPEQIQESFTPPEAISFWSLPMFINDLTNAGLSAQGHILYWHKLLITPILYSTMVFFAAAFSLRLPRFGKTGLYMAGGIVVGFMIRFFSDLASAVGIAGNIPVIFAAWAPVLISLLIGAALILHLEDG